MHYIRAVEHHTTSNEKLTYLFEISLAMDHLAVILQLLGISEYLGRFIDAGFSTWEAPSHEF
jgi:hypothetical protein